MTNNKTNDKTTTKTWTTHAQSVHSSIPTLSQIFANLHLTPQTNNLILTPSPQTTKTLQSYARPNTPHTIESTLTEAREIFAYRARTNHPRFFSFVPSPASPLSWLGETLTSAYNAFAGSRLQSAGPSAVESELIAWMAEQAGFSGGAGGLAVSGGSMANLTAMVLARDRVPREQWGVGVAYVSDQTHSSVAKGLRVLGFAGDQVRCVATDGVFRMDVGALEAAILEDRGKGLYPFVVIASCGTTNTGAVDPLGEIVGVARREGMWVHVDGAYGASALLSESRKGLLRGLEGVDSVSWDAHKWLFQTYGCGVILVRDREALRRSFHTEAEYIKDAEEGGDGIPNFWNFGIELTRPARIMKLWFTLRVLGVEGFDKYISHGFLLAEAAERELRGLKDWEVTSAASLAILTFRFKPEGRSERELDELNVAVSQRLTKGGVAGVLTTKVRGVVVLRMCTISPLMTEEEIVSIIREIDVVSRKVLAGSNLSGGSKI